jgi:hypothetical protein
VEGELDSREEETFDERSQMAGQVGRSEIAVSEAMISQINPLELSGYYMYHQP